MLYQKLLGGLGLATVARESCHDVQTTIDFVIPEVYTKPYWRYFVGADAKYDQVINWTTNLIKCGVAGGGHTANVFTDHGAGAIFWTAPAGHYDLTHSTLTPANEAARLKLKDELDPNLVKIVLQVADSIQDVVSIPEISYFPKDDAALLKELLSYPIASAGDKYVFMFPDATSVELNKLMGTLDNWKFIDSFTLGKGNTSVDGFPQENGPGFEQNIWMYPVGKHCKKKSL